MLPRAFCILSVVATLHSRRIEGSEVYVDPMWQNMSMCIVVECNSSDVRKVVRNTLAEEFVALTNVWVYSCTQGFWWKPTARRTTGTSRLNRSRFWIPWFHDDRRQENVWARMEDGFCPSRESWIMIDQYVMNDVIEISVMKFRSTAVDYVWIEFLEMDMTDGFSGVQYSSISRRQVLIMKLENDHKTRPFKTAFIFVSVDTPRDNQVTNAADVSIATSFASCNSKGSIVAGMRWDLQNHKRSHWQKHDCQIGDSEVLFKLLRSSLFSLCSESKTREVEEHLRDLWDIRPLVANCWNQQFESAETKT